jgi:hypothetical protein
MGVLLMTTCSYADEVQLNNGDRLTGVVVKMEDGVLTLKTDYGGEIRISWDQVAAVTSTKPMQVKVSAEVERFRALLLGGYELIETTKLGPGGIVPLTDVKGINLGHPIPGHIHPWRQQYIGKHQHQSGQRCRTAHGPFGPAAALPGS